VATACGLRSCACPIFLVKMASLLLPNEVRNSPRLQTGIAAEPRPQYVQRVHSWPKAMFLMSGLAMCITVDILQYSMPLAFLPSVLEDRGHSPIKIATAIGIYYWTGFLGGMIITSYQIWRVLYEKPSGHGHEVSEYSTVQRHIKYLIFGLGVGTVTLFIQAIDPSWKVHVCCRFIQGFAGAFIFFYTFLLAVALFINEQQVWAMTCVQCALNVAEILGSFIGAVLFIVWGQRSVFWFLGVVSMINQVMLVAILYAVLPNDEPRVGLPSPILSRTSTPLSITPPPVMVGDPDAAGGPAKPRERGRTCGCIPKSRPGAWDNFVLVLQNRQFACSLVLIFTAAVVKGSVEEMLPFHADHRWGYDPMEIGKLFCTIAIAYIISSLTIAKLWTWLARSQVVFSSYFLFMLGLCAWMVFATVSYYKASNALLTTLAMYGVCLGMTHTPAGLLLASVVDHAEGTSKEALNGIWNTMWEAGGSLGFLLGGLLAESYHEQMALLSSFCLLCCVSALVMVAIFAWPEDDGFGKPLLMDGKSDEDYGGTTA